MIADDSATSIIQKHANCRIHDVIYQLRVPKLSKQKYQTPEWTMVPAEISDCNHVVNTSRLY